MAPHPPGIGDENEENQIAEFIMEIRDASPSHLLIKIESFSVLWEHGIQKYESTEFSAGDYKWKLIIYPSGDYISADFAMVETSSLPVGWEVNAIFSIFLYNQILDKYLCFRGSFSQQEDSLVFIIEGASYTNIVLYSSSSVVGTWTGKMRRFHAIKSEWGLSKFISNKALRDPSNGYLVNDNCVFGAEIFVIKNQRAIERVSALKVTDPYKRDWKISNFSKLGGVWTSEEFTAVSFQPLLSLRVCLFHHLIQYFLGKLRKIELYPNGHGSEIGRSVSIFLDSVDSKGFASHEKLWATVCMRIRNQLCDKHRSEKYSRWFTSSGNNWGWHAFIPISDMRDTSKGFIVDDCCLLETEISVQVVVARDPS